MSSIALWPARRALQFGDRVGRRAGQALAEPARRAVLSSLDAALAAADAAVTSPLAQEAASRILASRLADDVFQRLTVQVIDSPELQRRLVQAIDSPEFERLISQALSSPEAGRLVAQVIDSRLVDVVVEQLLVCDGLWLLIDEIAQSPSVTAAISHQGVGFANQIAGVARERSRTADDRLERLAARLTRRPRAISRTGGEPAS